MSHAATNWAIAQRGLKPATKIVLWHLADCHNPSHGCFPSQDYLSDRCEMSRSSLNEHLATLESLGLIRREQRRDTRTRKQENTRYHLAFEEDFGANPSPKSGHGSSEPVSGNLQKPCPENGESRVQNPDTNPVREPVTEPLSAQEREREGGIEDRKKIETAYWRLIRSWPKLTGQPKDDALKAFFNLTPEERAEAERKFPVWLEVLKAQGRDHTYHPKTYFGKKLFADVPEPKPADSTDGRSVEPPFGPGWMAERFLKLLAGPTVQPKLTRAEEMMVQQGRYTVEQLLAPKRVQSGFPSVNLMDEFAGRGKGSVAPALAVELKPLMEAVKPDFPIFEQWRELHEANGWPWIPDPGSQPVVFFPKGGPQGLEAFKAVIAGEGGEHDGGRCEAAE